MRIRSSVSKEEYLRALRQHMGPVSNVGRQRFTGAFWGSFFYIKHNAPWEWNRMISGEACSALGFVTPREDGCQVSYLKFLGGSDPKSLIKCFLIFQLIAWFYNLNSVTKLSLIHVAVGAALCVLYSVGACLITENGWWVKERLERLLRDPVSFKKTK